MKKRIEMSQVLIIFMIMILIVSTKPIHVKAVGSYEVVVHPSIQHQTVKGWGTSLAWWGNAIGNWSDTTKKNDIIEKLFDPVNGIGLNIARYNIGGGENPTHEHMRDKAEIEGFQPSQGVWDWNADAGQRWVLQQAISQGVNITEAFSNSPPYWMTKSNCAAGNTDGSNNLKDDMYDDFANYLAEVVDHFDKSWGITFDSLAPVNEPTSTWWKSTNNQEGCHFDKDKQILILKEVQTALNNKSLSTKLSGPEEYSTDYSVDTINAYDSEVLGYVDTFNTHTYNGSSGAGLRRLAEKHTKELWVSEVGKAWGSHDTTHNKMDSSMYLARHIIRDMKITRPEAWVYWQAVENEATAISQDHNYGLMHANFSGVEDYWILKAYYAMGNFSKYIRPGYVILDAFNTVDSLVAYDKVGKKLVIVTMNDSNSDKTVTFDLSGFSSVTGSVTPYRTSSTENLQQLNTINVVNKTFTATSNVSSITTYVVSGVEYNGAILEPVENLVDNGDFDMMSPDVIVRSEDNDYRYFSPWNRGGDDWDAINIVSGGVSGHMLQIQKSSNYKAYLYQVAKAIDNKKYILKAKVKSSGGHNKAQLEIKQYGGEKVILPIPTTNDWVEIAIPSIDVTTGMIEVGIWVDSVSNKWVEIDDIRLVEDLSYNYVENGNFDKDGLNLSPWVPGGYTGTSYAEGNGVTGNRAAQWKDSYYQSYLYQIINNVPNGTYELIAKVKSSGGQNTAQMQVKNYGGSQTNLNIPYSDEWKVITIDNINVTNNSIEVAFWSDAPSGKWINIDDVVLVEK